MVAACARGAAGRRYVTPRLLRREREPRRKNIHAAARLAYERVSGTVNANWVALCRGELCANFVKVSYRRESTSGKLIPLMPTRTVISGLDRVARNKLCIHVT